MKKLLITTALLTLAACSEVPREAFKNRGDPENLLDQSSEVINITLASAASVEEVTNWVNQDQPTRAELYCMESDKICSETQLVLEQFGVPVQFMPSADNTAVLIYERVLARDCEHRYIDNTINPYNFNHLGFGCSVASNTLQMVTDKQQITQPALMDMPDAAKAVQAYGKYSSPPQDKRQDSSFSKSLLDTANKE